MFISIVLNTEYMDIASRSKWYLKCLLHCKQNGWILITHDYMRNHIEDLQKEITPSLFESWEIQPFDYQDVESVEQYFIPDSVFSELENYYGSRSEMLFALNNTDCPLLRKYLDSIINDIKSKHTNNPIEGFFNILESFECVRRVAKMLSVPVINYSFSAIRKPHGYRQTLYHVNFNNYWDSTECFGRWKSFEKDVALQFPLLTNKEIISLIGKERTLPLLRLMSSPPKYEVGICCEFYSMLPQVFTHSKYTDDDIFYECKRLYGKEKIKVRSHSLHLDDIQVDRSEVHNDPASFILSCKRLTAVQSQIILKALLWNKVGVMKKDTLAFSFLCSKKYDSNLSGDLLGLNFYLFGYLIPSDLMFSDEYWKWRLSNPTEIEIFERHLDFLFNTLKVDKEKFNTLKGEERFRYLLECRHCDDQLIESLLCDETLININWDVASSRFVIVSKNNSKSYWRIDTVNTDGSLSTNLWVNIKEATEVQFYPLDDVAGMTRLKKVIINGRVIDLDTSHLSFKYMPKGKGMYTFLFENTYTGKLKIECTWEYKKVFDFLNENN